jgi:hypothetical protein
MHALFENKTKVADTVQLFMWHMLKRKASHCATTSSLWADKKKCLPQEDWALFRGAVVQPLLKVPLYV